MRMCVCNIIHKVQNRNKQNFQVPIKKKGIIKNEISSTNLENNNIQSKVFNELLQKVTDLQAYGVNTKRRF